MESALVQGQCMICRDKPSCYAHCDNCNNDICYDCLLLIDEKIRNQCWHCHANYCPYQEHLTDKQMQELHDCVTKSVIAEYESRIKILNEKARRKYEELQELYSDMMKDIFVFDEPTITSHIIQSYRNLYKSFNSLEKLAQCKTVSELRKYKNKTAESFVVMDETKYPFVIELIRRQNELMKEHKVYIWAVRTMLAINEETLNLIKERFDAIRQTNTYRIAKLIYDYDISYPISLKRFDAEAIIEHFKLTVDVAKNKPIMCCRKNGCRGAIRESDSSFTCDRCLQEYCSKCMQPKHESSCKEEDLSEWKILQEETKPCPRCGYRFGHHAYCHDMWCINCYCCFQYETGYIYKGKIDNKERDEYFKLNLDLYDVMPQLDNDTRHDLIRAKVKNANIRFIIEEVNLLARYQEFDIIEFMKEINSIENIAKMISIAPYAIETVIELTRAFSIDNSFSRIEKYNVLNKTFIRFIHIMKACQLNPITILLELKKLDARMLRPLWESLDYETYIRIHSNKC